MTCIQPGQVGKPYSVPSLTATCTHPSLQHHTKLHPAASLMGIGNMALACCRNPVPGWARFPLQSSKQEGAAHRQQAMSSRKEGKAEGREGSEALSQSPECCCLWQPQHGETLSAVTGFFLWLTPIIEVRPHGLGASLMSGRQLLSAWKLSYPNTCEMKGADCSRTWERAGCVHRVHAAPQQRPMLSPAHALLPQPPPPAGSWSCHTEHACFKFFPLI